MLVMVLVLIQIMILVLVLRQTYLVHGQYHIVSPSPRGPSLSFIVFIMFTDKHILSMLSHTNTFYDFPQIPSHFIRFSRNQQNYRKTDSGRFWQILTDSTQFWQILSDSD